MEPDRELERLFLDARAEDERHAPSFANVLRARAARARSVRLGLSLAFGRGGPRRRWRVAPRHA